MTTTVNRMTKINTMSTTSLKIGLVSISDRASTGAYQDQGIPALQEWFGAALSSPWQVETQLIADERALIEQTLIELVDQEHCHLVPTTGGTDATRHRKQR